MEKVKYPNLEVLIAVDTHEDKTIDIVREFETEHSNLIVDFSKKRRGVVRALNSLLKKVKGDIIIHFGSDFRFYNPSKCFYKLVKYFDKNPKVGAITFNIRFPKKMESGFISRLVCDWRMKKYPIISDKFEYPIFCHSFRRKVVKQIDPETINDDAEWCYSTLNKGYKILFAKDIFIYSVEKPMGKHLNIKKTFSRERRITVGWLKIVKKRKIKLFKYYASLFIFFLTNFYHYKVSDIVSFFYFIPIYFISIVGAFLKRKAKITEVWTRPWGDKKT